MMNPRTATAIAVAIDVVMCTYNRAADLQDVLAGLSVQKVDQGIEWSVLVVDNASTDRTADVVEAYRARRLLPGLRRVLESEQGLTPARRRGVQETSAPWIAFVDDDNLLEPGWLQAVAAAIQSHPQAGAIGGRVVLDWEQPPPDFIKRFGFCFAEQEPGDTACEMSGLVGAGMVVRREALVKCGWLERPLLADRTGKRLLSGGDVEIAQRIRAAGCPLWFTPEAVLRHRLPSSRATFRYLLRMSYALGQCEALVSALGWPGDWPAWLRAARRRSIRAAAHALLKSHGVVMASTSLSFAAGFTRGVAACMAMAPEARKALLGSAVPTRADDRGEWDDPVLGLIMLIGSLRRLFRWIYHRRVRRTWAARRLRRLWWGIRMRANRGVCSIEIANVGVGFFGQMTWCLYLLEHCHRHNLIPDIRLTGDSYRDPNRGANWLEYYFDLARSRPSDELARSIRYTKKAVEWEDMGQPMGAAMSIEDGSRILHRYLTPKPHIMRLVFN